MTRAASFLLVFGFMLAAAIPGGCASDPPPAGGLCEPLKETPCYIGPPSAGGVGSCSLGATVCSADGLSFGECEGSVLPAFQSCASGVDTDCDGAAACSGAHRWSQGLIGQGDKYPAGVSVDKDGNITVAGDYVRLRVLSADNAGNTVVSGPMAGRLAAAPAGAAIDEAWRKGHPARGSGTRVDGAKNPLDAVRVHQAARRRGSICSGSLPFITRSRRSASFFA